MYEPGSLIFSFLHGSFSLQAHQDKKEFVDGRSDLLRDYETLFHFTWPSFFLKYCQPFHYCVTFYFMRVLLTINIFNLLFTCMPLFPVKATLTFVSYLVSNYPYILYSSLIHFRVFQ